jgi:acetylornithine deacetylase/succinyl-diaminopimelate desuccinylase-like protein
MKAMLLAATAFAVATGANASPLSPARHDASKAMFERIVNIPTVLGRGKVPEMANYLAEEFRKAGFPAADVKVLPYTSTNLDGTLKDETAAVMVIWRAAGTPKAKPLLLMGHMDVVEAKREDSTTDPFVLTEKDGYYYGRGTIDMKDGITAITQAMIDLRASGFKPKRDVVAFFTGDEETNGVGAKKGATEWLAQMGHPELGLNADGGGIGFTMDDKPLGAQIQTAEKTYADYTLTVRNRGGHSSKPRNDNAIYQLAHALEKLQTYRFEPVLNETSRAYFTAMVKIDPRPEMRATIGKWLAGDNNAADAVEADETYVGLTRTRCVPTRLFGGHANNALPQLATALINCRIIPGVEPDAIAAELSKIVADPEVKVTRNDDNVASLASPLRPDVMAAFNKATLSLHPGMPIFPEMSTGASDARPFRVAGVPVYGVSGGWVRVPVDLRAHGKDERLPVAALDDGVQHFKVLIQEMAGK